MLWSLFINCFKVGAFTIGGGYAMLPVMKDVFVNQKNWVSEEEFVDMVSVIQTVPGAIAVNSSIYLGRKVAGIPGAIAATLGSVLPSFLIILLIATTLTSWYQNPHVANFFAGVRPAVVGLILVSGIKLGKDILSSKLNILLTLIFAFLALVLKIHPVLLLAFGALSGMFLYQRSEE
ncbi:MAG: chromate transporter [Firmicutes bacterium]|nr:chromate transporter [Bacillota bacterium]MDD4263053.1 chromate transporter [Bacillota bacterium]MDD4692798.1 chromate transporter [Bacillota bacterium]